MESTLPSIKTKRRSVKRWRKPSKALVLSAIDSATWLCYMLWCVLEIALVPRSTITDFLLAAFASLGMWWFVEYYTTFKDIFIRWLNNEISAYETNYDMTDRVTRLFVIIKLIISIFVVTNLIIFLIRH